MLAVENWRRPHRRGVRAAVAVPLAWALLTSACGKPAPKPVEKEVVTWKQLGEWSGSGNAQTESFIGLTGALRMHWRTKNDVSKGAGSFKVMLQSAISGRDLQQLVDQTGQGEGTAYTAEDPRAFQITVESAKLDWSFEVEEAVFTSPPRTAKGSR